MPKKALKVGIMPREQYKQRTMAIVRGEYVPKKDEPKVWFESIKSFSEVLDEKNQELLALIEAHRPQSLHELEVLSGRKRSNLSRTLKTMESYGLVRLDRVNRRLIPRAEATRFQVDIALPAVRGGEPRAAANDDSGQRPTTQVNS